MRSVSKYCRSKTSRYCWYRITYYECPLCGKTDTYRERMYTKKPKDRNKRVFWGYGKMCANSHFL